MIIFTHFCFACGSCISPSQTTFGSTRVRLRVPRVTLTRRSARWGQHRHRRLLAGQRNEKARPITNCQIPPLLGWSSTPLSRHGDSVLPRVWLSARPSHAYGPPPLSSRQWILFVYSAVGTFWLGYFQFASTHRGGPRRAWRRAGGLTGRASSADAFAPLHPRHYNPCHRTLHSVRTPPRRTPPPTPSHIPSDCAVPE